MVSLVENIDSVNVDNADDSDAPIEVTTKTSKTENKQKKQKKKKTKRRIQYTLATEQDDDPNEKPIDEESALTHIVFGDDDEYLEDITIKAKKDKQVY